MSKSCWVGGRPRFGQRRFALLGLALLAGMILFSICAAAQGSSAITGKVTDTMKAAISGAEIDIVEVNSGVARSTKTNAQGDYSFPALNPGPYTLNVKKEGFGTISVTNVILNVEEHQTRDFVLTVGVVELTITVTADANHVNTEDATVSTVVDRATVENMPLNGRSFQNLLALSPGTNTLLNRSFSSANDQGQFSVNGQRADSNYFTVDGVSANTGSSGGNGSLGQGATGSLPGTTSLGGFNGLVSIDAIQEFRSMTSSFAPEYGRTPGAQVSIATRAGTNKFHGDVFDYLRNTVLDANDWLLNRAGKPRGTERQNDFGGVFGGPILKDKLFFFLSYEGLRLANPLPGTILTFTSDARAQAAAASNGAANGYMAQILNAYPLPDGNPATPCTALPGSCVAPLTRTFPQNSQVDSGSVRIDYPITSKVTIFGRYAHAPSQAFSNNSTVSLGPSSTRLGSDSGTVGITDFFSNAITNELRVNFSRSITLSSFSAPASFKGSLASLFPSAQIPSQFSGQEVAIGIQFFGLAPSLNIQPQAVNSAQDQFNIVDTLSALVGSHGLKFGLDFRLSDPNINRAPFQLVANFFTPTEGGFGGFGGLAPTCNSPAIGLPQYICGEASSLFLSQDFKQEFRIPNWSLFAQDTWKVTRRLTLTYGVRYEINPAPYSANGRPFFSLNNWDPALCTTTPSLSSPSGTPFCNVGVNPLGTSQYSTSWKNIAPRVGVAYQLTQSRRSVTVLRGGFGIFYDTADNASAQTGGPFQPFIAAPGPMCPPSAPGPSLFIQFPLTNAGCVTPPSPQTTIGPSSPYASFVQATAPNLKLPYTYEFNVALQRALGERQSVTATYTGAISRNLIGAVLASPFSACVANCLFGGPPPTFVNDPVSPTFAGSLAVFGNYATSDYHALQLQFQRQFAGGMGATASYTWSHAIDDASSFTSGAFFPFTTNRSSSDFDTRHMFNVSLEYQIPTPFKHVALAQHLFGHWSVDPLYRFQTAPPLNVTAGFEVLTPLIQVAQRPNLIPQIPIYVYGANCVAENGGGGCPGGRALNNAPVFNVPPPGGAAPFPQCEISPVMMTPGGPVPVAVGEGAFCTPPPNPVTGQPTQGDVGRNFLRGFNLSQLDLDLHRDFPVRDRVHIRFESDFFNILNHPNFNSPQGNFAEPQFGLVQAMANGIGAGAGGISQLYQTGGPRSVQLAFKIVF